MPRQHGELSELLLHTYRSARVIRGLAVGKVHHRRFDPHARQGKQAREPRIGVARAKPQALHTGVEFDDH